MALKAVSDVGPGLVVVSRFSELVKAHPHLALTGIAFFLYVTSLAVFVWGLGFNMFRSDAVAYWRNSFDWGRLLFSTAWVPGYSAAIALVRIVIFDSLPPLAVMWPLAAVFYVASINIAYRLFSELGVSHPWGFGLAYAVFPFVGLTGAVAPTSGSMAMTTFLLTALAHRRQQWPQLAIYGALALLTHKALWFFLLPLFAITLVTNRGSRRFILLSVIPLGLLWGAGTAYHGNAWWMMARSARQLMWSAGALPAFDGLITSLLSYSGPKLLKGVVVLGLFLLAGALLYRSLRSHFWLGAAICVGTIAMTAVLNQHEVFAVVRFGRLLMIPVASLGIGALGLPSYWTSRLLVAAFLLGVITNFVFALYATQFYFSETG